MKFQPRASDDPADWDARTTAEAWANQYQNPYAASKAAMNRESLFWPDYLAYFQKHYPRPLQSAERMAVIGLHDATNALRASLVDLEGSYVQADPAACLATTQPAALATPESWLKVTGLTLPERTLTPDEEDAITLALALQGDQRQWCRGDWALYVRNKVDQRASAAGWSTVLRNQVWDRELRSLADRFGCSHVTLQKNISCCLAWPQHLRQAGHHVRYKHHELISRQMREEMGDDQAVSLLQDCEAAAMTYKQFAVYLATGEMPEKPQLFKPNPFEHIDPEDGADDLFVNTDDPHWEPVANTDDLFGQVPSHGDVHISLLRHNVREHLIEAEAGSAAIEIRFGDGNTWLVIPDSASGTVALQKVMEVESA